MSTPYEENLYRATVIRHVDADTTHLRVDMGFDCRIDLTIRWAGIDAPEISTPEGLDALDWVVSQIPAGTTVLLGTYKDKREKFGRYLGRIYTLPDRRCLNDELIASGMARTYRTADQDDQ